MRCSGFRSCCTSDVLGSRFAVIWIMSTMSYSFTAGFSCSTHDQLASALLWLAVHMLPYTDRLAPSAPSTVRLQLGRLSAALRSRPAVGLRSGASSDLRLPLSPALLSATAAGRPDTRRGHDRPPAVYVPPAPTPLTFGDLSP